jgi:hypothetical protein
MPVRDRGDHSISLGHNRTFMRKTKMDLSVNLQQNPARFFPHEIASRPRENRARKQSDTA